MEKKDNGHRFERKNDALVNISTLTWIYTLDVGRENKR
jgi:hypothetical protein